MKALHGDGHGNSAGVKSDFAWHPLDKEDCKYLVDAWQQRRREGSRMAIDREGQRREGAVLNASHEKAVELPVELVTGPETGSAAVVENGAQNGNFPTGEDESKKKKGKKKKKRKRENGEGTEDDEERKKRRKKKKKKKKKREAEGFEEFADGSLSPSEMGDEGDAQRGEESKKIGKIQIKLPSRSSGQLAQ